MQKPGKVLICDKTLDYLFQEPVEDKMASFQLIQEEPVQRTTWFQRFVRWCQRGKHKPAMHRRCP